MPLFQTPLEERISNKFKQIEEKLRNSVSLIHKDIGEMNQKIESMKNHLKKQDKQYQYGKKQDKKIREKFRQDVDEFNQKTKQLRLAFDKVKSLQDALVVKKELAQIEDKIKLAFKEEINQFKEQEKEFKKHINDFNKRLVRVEVGKINKKQGFFKRVFGNNKS